MTTRAPTYREASRELLAQARAEMDAGDLRQASEKAWGAAAQILKAVCEAREWPHNQHRHLWTAAQDLSDEVGDDELHDLFVSANSLHVNFYEDTYTARRVALNVARVEQFVARLEALLDG